MHDKQIASITDLQQEKLVGVQVAGVELIAVEDGEQIRVFEGRCPHQGNLLSEGDVENGRLTCRAHGWQFHCTNGIKIDDEKTCLHQFSAVVEDGEVLVDAAEIAAWAEANKEADGVSGERPLRTPDKLPGPNGLPLLGNMHQIKVDQFHLILEDWYRQYGDLYQFNLGPQQVVVTADPDMIQTILQSRPDQFSRLSDIKKTIEEMGVQGLFSAEGEQWRRHRQLATRAFDVRHLREFFPTMTKVTERLYHRWQQFAEQQASLDAQKELMRYTVDVTTNLAFGYDMNTLEEDGDIIQQHIERIFPMIAFRTFMPVRYWHYFKLPKDRSLDESVAALRTSVNEFIDNAREQMAEDRSLHEHPKNLLQALLAAQADEDVEFSDLEIFGNVFTFLLAGEDTTANTMAWMLYFMAQYPETQKQMQAEADAVLANSLTVASYEQVNKLQFIEAVAHETMRFKPVATFLGLQALTDVTIKDLQIPQGTPVIVLIRSKGLEESEFEAAAEFKPERWLNYARQDNPHHKKSFAPFGGGPRLCPGRSLALLEIKMALSTICRHFDVVRVDPKREIEERFVFTMMPQDLMISLRPRQG